MVETLKIIKEISCLVEGYSSIRNLREESDMFIFIGKGELFPFEVKMVVI